MENFYRDLQLNSKVFTGSNWGCKLIKFLWSESHKLWKLRCHLVHSQRHYVSSRLNRLKLLQKARSIFQSSDRFTAVDRQILDAGLDHVLAMPTSDLAAWVHSANQIFAASAQEQDRITATLHGDIRCFFVHLDRGHVISRVPKTAARNRSGDGNRSIPSMATSFSGSLDHTFDTDITLLTSNRIRQIPQEISFQSPIPAPQPAASPPTARRRLELIPSQLYRPRPLSPQQHTQQAANISTPSSPSVQSQSSLSRYKPTYATKQIYN